VSNFSIHELVSDRDIYFGLMLLIAVSQALHWRTGHKNDCLQIISSSAASNSVLPTVGKGDYVWITKAIYTLNI
jgi:hypothetical protein